MNSKKLFEWAARLAKLAEAVVRLILVCMSE